MTLLALVAVLIASGTPTAFIACDVLMALVLLIGIATFVLETQLRVW